MSTNTKIIASSVSQNEAPLEVHLTPESSVSIGKNPAYFSVAHNLDEDLSITWGLSVPVGSSADVEGPDYTEPRYGNYGLFTSRNSSTAVLYPDVSGIYVISASVKTSGGSVVTKTANLLAIAKDISREKPDSSLIQNNIPDFWRVMEGREVLSSVWSEYVTAISKDYRTISEISLAKSINTIQPGKSVEDTPINLSIDLENHSTSVKFSDSFFGTGTAHTSTNHLTFSAIATGRQTLIPVKGNPFLLENISSVDIEDPELSGSYTLKKFFNSYILLSSKTRLKQNSRIDVQTGMKLIGGSNLCFSTSTNNIQKGDYIYTGTKYVEVLETYSTDNTLPGPNYLKVNTTFEQTKSNQIISYFRSFTITLRSSGYGKTKVVYVPSAELGGSGFFSTVSSTTVKGLLTSRSSIRIPSKVFTDNMVSLYGTLDILIRGSYYKTRVVGFAENSLGNYDPLSDVVIRIYPEVNIEVNPDIPIDSEFKFVSTDKHKDLLFTVDGTSSTIQSVNYFTDKDGIGHAKITLDSTAVANKPSLNWRICSTLMCSTHDNFAADGVTYGDILRIDISNSINNNKSFMDCFVVGSYKNYVSFELTNETLINDVEPETLQDPDLGDLLPPRVSDYVLARILTQLGLPGIAYSSYSPVFSGLANKLVKSKDNTVKLHKYLKVSSSIFGDNSTISNTIFVSPGGLSDTYVRLGIKPKFIQRTSFIPLTDRSVLSVPYITQFVYPKEASPIEGSNRIAILFKDGTTSPSVEPEIQLFENTQFFIYNSGGFTGSNLNKAKNTDIVTSLTGFFIERRVEPGDILFCDNVEYIISEVIDSNTLKITSKDVLSIEKINASYEIKKLNLEKGVSYIVFRYGVFSLNRVPPVKMFIPTIILDNTSAVEDNFGCLVGYYLKDFLDYSEPQIQYINAVKGLMYALTAGPSLKAVKLAASILLNIPVSEFSGVITLIDKDAGRVVINEVDSFGNITDVSRVYRFSTEETYDQFRQIAKHHNLNRQYRVSDSVPALQPISDKIIVRDYVKSPEFFTGIPLQQYHTWQVEIDAKSVDSRDIPLLKQFYDNLKPIHTKPEISLVLFLLDKVEAFDSIQFYIDMRLYDDPAFGLELTHMYDSTNNSGQILRLSDNGELSTRTISLGRDLIITSTTRASSFRGGFLLNEPSHVSTDPNLLLSADTKFLKTYKPFYKDDDPDTQYMNVKGKFLVKSGDILRIYTGKNTGIYEITSVVSDTELDIQPLNGFLPYTTIPEPDSTDQAFAIFRRVNPVIVSGLICQSAVQNNTITFTTAALNWDGVTVADTLVNEGNHAEKYEILEVKYNNNTEDSSVTLIVDKNVSIAISTSFLIYRDALTPYEVTKGEVGVSYDAFEPRRVPHNLTDSYKLKIGDKVLFTSGAYTGHEATIVLVEHSAFFIAEFVHPFPIASGDTFEVRRPTRPPVDSSDKRLELLHGQDNVSAVLESVSASVEAGATLTSPSGVDYRTITGALSNYAKPGDIVVLRSGSQSGMQVYEGVVGFIHPTTAVVYCYDIYVNALLATATQYFIQITKRSFS